MTNVVEIDGRSNEGRGTEIVTPDGSEDAIAWDFVSNNVHDLRYVAEMGKWYRFDGCRWGDDKTNEVKDRVRDCVRDAALLLQSAGQQRSLARAATVGGVERLARSDQRVAALAEHFDADPFILNTPEGIVDLLTGEMRQSDPAAMCSKCTAVSPAPAGTPAPQWTQFLKDVTSNDDELIAYLRRVAGYMLTGDVSEHALFFAFGVGANGKSVLFNTLRDVWQDYATTATAELFLASKTERHPTELARLRGFRLVVASEIDAGQRWNEARIKSLTGGDPIVAHFMRQDDFEFKPQFKPAILGNHRPALRNVGVAIKRRVNMIPFERVFDTPDPEMGEKLKAEWPQILRWAIDGCLEWRRGGLQPPARVIAATNSYLADQDVLGQWIEDCCVEEAGTFATSTALFGSWRRWREGRSERPGTEKGFVALLEDRGIERKRKPEGRGFLGLKVLPQESSDGYGNSDPVPF